MNFIWMDFDKEEQFLADDSGTEFYGDGHDKLKIVRKMTYEELKLSR